MGLQDELETKLDKALNNSIGATRVVAMALTPAHRTEAKGAGFEGDTPFVKWVEIVADSACIAVGISDPAVTAIVSKVTIKYHDVADHHAGGMLVDR